MREWLKKARLSLGLTHQQIADKCNISRVHYTNIENGKRNPTVEIAKKIAEVLCVDWTRFYE